MQGSIDFTGLLSGDIIGEGGTTVVANPSGSATDTLNKVQIDETIYSVEGGGGSEVIANPTGTPTEDINTIEIDEVIYQIKGEKGDDGADGTSAYASVSKVGNTATITCTDANGTTTAQISDGTNGTDGQGVPTGGTAGQVLIKDSATDYDTSWTSLDASDIPYDNTTSGMTATDVQDAVSELKSNLMQLDGLTVYRNLTPQTSYGSFNDGSTLPLISLTSNIVPVQAGSGDPSPTNIRPISGFTKANMVVSPTTDAEDGTTYTIQFKDGSNPLTVYSGTLDVVSGVLTVLGELVDMGDLSVPWGYVSNGNRFTNGSLASLIKTPSTDEIAVEAITSQLKVLSLNDLKGSSNDALFAVGDTGIISVRYTSCGTDTEALKTALTGVELVYPLATPTTIQLTPTQVNSLLGQNYIFSDTGNITNVKYIGVLNFS